MKKLNELGISPLPWTARTSTNKEVAVVGLKNDERRSVQDVALCRGGGRHADARLIVSAPDLYEALLFQCFGDTGVGNCRNCKGAELGNCKECPLGKARAALAKAAGESILM